MPTSLLFCLLACSRGSQSPLSAETTTPEAIPPTATEDPAEPGAEGPPAEPTAASSLGAELTAALSQPDLRGDFLIEADKADGSQVDRCVGTARAVLREGELVGLAQCSFTGELQSFGATVGVFRVPADATVGSFDASPAPVVAPVVMSVGDDGSRSLRFEGEVDFEDGGGLSYRGSVALTAAKTP